MNPRNLKEIKRAMFGNKKKMNNEWSSLKLILEELKAFALPK